MACECTCFNNILVDTKPAQGSLKEFLVSIEVKLYIVFITYIEDTSICEVVLPLKPSKPTFKKTGHRVCKVQFNKT